VTYSSLNRSYDKPEPCKCECNCGSQILDWLVGALLGFCLITGHWAFALLLIAAMVVVGLIVVLFLIAMS